MENHPIPQDITGFQFKLIGNMTVRQFIYLATGAVIAAFVFFILPIPFIIRLPIAIISLSIGASFAFIPIGGRPMDTMVANFFKALFAPTQYIYQKTGGDLSKQPSQPQAMQTPTSAPTQTPQMKTPAATPPLTPPQETSVLQEQPHPLEKILEVTIKQKEALEKELSDLKSALDTQKPNPAPQPPIQDQTLNQPAISTPSPDPLPMQQPAQTMPAPPPSLPSPLPQATIAQQGGGTTTFQPAKQAVGLSIPESPNLIIGIVNDPRGNPLQNILVEVKDEEGSPVRAFKTNGLGRFAAATSLANGKYILVLEDPKGVNKFDSLQIEAVGNPIPPVQITSVDPREELRRQLFN